MEIIDNFFKFYSQNPVGLDTKKTSFVHIEWFSATIILIIIGVYLYSRLKPDVKRVVIRICAFSLLATEILRTIWAVSIHHYSLNSMLPLHLCGIMIFVEFFAVVSDNRALMEFAYYCGLPGAFIGLLTPELNGYVFFSFQNLIYIIRHGLLMLIPFLWIFGDGFKPTKIGAIKSLLMLCLLAMVDMTVNAMLKGNYLFISKVPPNGFFQMIVRKIGYIGYVSFVILGAILAIYLMYLPWIINIKQKFIKKLSTNED
jgi:hypothetical integral membrane protein (TIGR02206 family)